MDFELVGPIGDIQTIAVGRGVIGLASYSALLVEAAGEN
jgi:hypothetical protein